MTAPSLLHKCEEFLLHPTVRALPLAQRVDFLEKKGLSPEEITQCLKHLERRNGLTQLARHTADYLKDSFDLHSRQTSNLASTSSLQLLRYVIKKYGVVTMLLMLLGYGYVHFRRQKMEQMLLQYDAAKIQRKKRQHLRVESLLAVVKDQQSQYEQAAKLLRARLANFIAAKKKAAKQSGAVKASASGMQHARGVELQALQSELLELKRAVVDKYVHPSVGEKVVEVKKLPMLLDVVASVPDRRKVEVVPTNAVTSQCQKNVTSAGVMMKTHETVARLEKPKAKRKDQTSMSSEEIVELYMRSQVEEELSTVATYRLLFASS